MTEAANRPTFIERASLAAGGSRLDVDHHGRTDLDYVLAMAFLAKQHNARAMPMMRLHLAASKENFDAALAYVLDVVCNLRDSERWRQSFQAIHHIARMALAHHICPVCPHCHGLKFKVTPGTPSLSHVICPHCRGDGRRQVQQRFKHEIERTLVALELLDNQTETEVRKVMR